jgi:uncharacterized OB-fold protein
VPDGDATTLEILAGGRCPRCELVMFPLRPACRRCGHSLDEYGLAPNGSVEASTTVRIAASGFEPPYRIGYVKLDAGPRVLALFAFDMNERVAWGRRVAVGLGAADGLLQARAEPE